MACGTRFKCTGASYLLVILFYCSAPLLPVLFASGAIAADTQQPATHHAHPNHHHGLSHHHRSINSTWSSRSQHTYHNRHKHEPVPHYRSYQTSTRSPPPTTTTTTTTSSSTSASVIKSGDSKQAASNVYQRLSAQESSAGRSIVYGGTVHHHRPPTQQQRELGGGGGFGGVLGPIYPNGVMTTTTSYNKYHPGRRVCSDFTSTQPQHQPQQQQRNNNRSPRLVYADNQQQQPQPGFLQCCPGWTQVSPLSYGCNKPVCLVACQNGGVCSSPGRCSCPKGFTGNYCQTDVDECETEKPCDQICRNVPGSYECYCRSGYELQPDRTSCRKNDSDGTALEARDLEFDYEEATTPNTRRTSGHRDTENEVSEGEGEPEETSYVELLRRLIKLEKQFAKGKKRETEANEIAARIASAIDSINEIRRSIQNMQLMQREVYELRNKVKLYEFETRKIQHLNNRVVDLENQLRLRCRTNVFFNRGSALY